MIMHARFRVITLAVVSAAVLAGSSVGAASAFGASAHPAKKPAAVFSTAHVAGAKGLVLVEGKGLVVYTFSGDRAGHAGTCTGQCAVIWPPVHGTPALAHGIKIKGKFGTIHGQVTFNGWPLYLFTGEKAKTDHADSDFKVVTVTAPHSAAAPAPAPTSPAPAPDPSSPAPTPSSPGW
jgi:predicted lipoprotein with Yx(FWY)xxD motif